jgi:hypothetical protein
MYAGRGPNIMSIMIVIWTKIKINFRGRLVKGRYAQDSRDDLVTVKTESGASKSTPRGNSSGVNSQNVIA